MMSSKHKTRKKSAKTRSKIHRFTENYGLVGIADIYIVLRQGFALL